LAASTRQLAKGVKTSQSMNSSTHAKKHGIIDNKSTATELRHLARAYRIADDLACKI
jgi:hypothetical protein